ncbi:pilus assembly PilX N-terminal domain-containing protein [Patescibacteria group bacterium]|nr:pilus assembly PilX N-terminal domain-containing protein [Patescibacteria group bacterium]
MINKNEGQVALIVLVVSAVVMTLGLSLSKKAIVETKIDTDDELLRQAFNAAESGVEYYLGTGEMSYTNTDGENAEVTVTDFGSGQEISSDGFVSQNEKALFWLVGHDIDGNINGSYYGEDSVEIRLKDGFAGAVAVDYYYLEGGTYKVSRYGYNYGGQATGFEDKTGNISLSVDVATPLLIAVSPFFEGSEITLVGGENFPAQGEEIKSVGRVSDNSMGGVSQQVQVFYRYEVPLFMLSAVSSGGSILSN